MRLNSCREGDELHRRLKPALPTFGHAHRTMNLISPSFLRVTRKFIMAAFLLGISLSSFITSAEAQTADERPDHVSIFNEAQNLHEKGDLAGAILLYDKAIKIEPAFPEAAYQRGVAELALGKSAEAEKSFRLALQLRPDWTLPMTSLGSLLVDKGGAIEAEKLLAKVTELEPQNALALTAITELRLKTGGRPEALREILVKISSLTGKAKTTAALWTARAALENALKSSTAAKASLERALASDPKNRPALFLAADIAIAEGDIVMARDYAARLESPASGGDPLRLLLASLLTAEGKLDDALAQLDSIRTPNVQAVDLRNRIRASLATSPAELEKQLEANAKDLSLLGRLCVLFRRENPAKALDYCRKASEAEPGNVNHAVGFGAALVQAKQYDSAVLIFRKLLEIVPDNATARANLATALFQLKRYPEAKAAFQWITTAQPRSAGAYLFLGIIHDESAEYLDAMANYQQYLRLADPVENKLDLEKIYLRLPALQKVIKEGRGKKK